MVHPTSTTTNSKKKDAKPPKDAPKKPAAAKGDTKKKGPIPALAEAATPAAPSPRSKAPAKKPTDDGTRRYYEIRREPHIFRKNLSEQEKREHATKVFECEHAIEKFSAEAKREKTFVGTELFGSEPVRLRAKEREQEHRSALLACDRKRADIMRDYHLHAAADGFIWVDIECAVTADDIDQEVFCTRLDTGDIVWRRKMNGSELESRKTRLQLELRGTEKAKAAAKTDEKSEPKETGKKGADKS